MAGLEESIEVAHPEQPHCATILLLDTSGSMSEQGKIKQLNEGLKFFKEDVSSDDLARKRIDLAVVGFGSDASLLHDFSSIETFEPPELKPEGSTPMGRAILYALDLVEKRKQEYKSKGIDYYRPWIFMITDGEPTDMSPGDSTWQEVVKSVRDGESKKKFLFFSVGVEPANMDLLTEISPSNRPPVRLRPGKFKEMFEWLSKSQSKVSASKVGEQVPLESPKGWAEVSTQ